jgi:hypothetical protein
LIETRSKAKVPVRFLNLDISWTNGVHQTMRARAKVVAAIRRLPQ